LESQNRIRKRKIVDRSVNRNLDFEPFEQLPVVRCLLPVGQKRELMRPILDPFRPVVFALKYCPHGEA
jgi:hypothetical protein